MPTVVPRWEWRGFGDHLAPAAAALGRMPVEQEVDSAETYLISARGVDLVKVRDGLVDVKHLQVVGEDGLERWTPVLKAAFPLSDSDLATVAAAWQVDLPEGAAEAGRSLDDLLETLVGPNPELMAVEVHKHRVRHKVVGCLTEMTEVQAAGERLRTIAIESEEPAYVLDALAEFGLALAPNVDYGRGLRLLERFGTERFAVIDVGTNSVKFHVGERHTDGTWHRIVDRAEVTRLGEGLQQSGRLEAEPMARTVEAIAHMVQEACHHRVAAIAAVGTAGLRIASNGAELVDLVQARCGVRIEIISGEDEARLAYLAAISALPATGVRVVFDTGGGSSQFTFGHDDRIDDQFSVQVGAARLTEEFGLDGAVSKETVRAALAAIAGDLERLDGRPAPDAVLAMGGAVTNLAAIKHGLDDYDPDVVQGTVLDTGEIDRQIELFRTRTAAQRRSIVGLQPARAEVVLAGACVVRSVLDKLGKDSLTVSDRGLRYGVLAERYAAREAL